MIIENIQQLLEHIETDKKAEELVDYINNLQQENKQLKIENAYYKSKVLGGNSQLKELNGKIETLGDKENER